MTRRLHTTCLVVVVWSCAFPSVAQVPDSPQEIYRSWCAQCHGADGKGQVPNPTVKTTPMDFTSCSLSTPEADADWAMVILRGGPAAGLSAEMPAFGEALDADRVRGLVDYLRTFCAEPGWPHGNLNFHRPIFTEKAFPEDELILVPAVAHERTTSAAVTAIFERRLGKRAQLELALPMQSVGGSGSR
ncbi:MAG: cytochrome c, partial [Acidobacteria bacterium]|nr:cytochrome c [Acidobacteriota bacterium]